MIYKVRAQFNQASATEFHNKLLDGTIAKQRPDGQEIVDSMNRAVVTKSGEIQWSEMCYCNSPLEHERQTVLEHHFDDISTEVIEGYQEYEGRPFMDYLAELAEGER